METASGKQSSFTGRSRGDGSIALATPSPSESQSSSSSEALESAPSKDLMVYRSIPQHFMNREMAVDGNPPSPHCSQEIIGKELALAVQPLHSSTNQSHGPPIISPTLTVDSNVSNQSLFLSSSLPPTFPIARPTRESVLRRLSEALMRRSLTMVGQPGMIC